MESAFQVTYEVADCGENKGPRGITASTDFGDLAGAEIGTPMCEGEAGPDGFALTGAGATYVLLNKGDASMLSVLMEGPMAITYMGTCE